MHCVVSLLSPQSTRGQLRVVPLMTAMANGCLTIAAITAVPKARPGEPTDCATVQCDQTPRPVHRKREVHIASPQVCGRGVRAPPGEGPAPAPVDGAHQQLASGHRAGQQVSGGPPRRHLQGEAATWLPSVLSAVPDARLVPQQRPCRHARFALLYCEHAARSLRQVRQRLGRNNTSPP